MSTIHRTEGVGRYWLNSELAIIRANFPGGGAEACQPLLKDRTIKAIQRQAGKLCVRKNRRPARSDFGVPRTADGPFGMSPREQDALQSLASGRGAKGIAIDLDISPSTASDHIKRLFKKFGVNNQVSLVLKAERAGLLEVDVHG